MRDRRDVHPESAGLWIRRKRFRQIRGHLGLRPECHRLYRNRHRVAHLCTCSPEHAVADPEPVASYSVRLKRCLKSAAVQRAFNHTHPARGKLAAGGLRQSENRLRADCYQFGLESDFRHKPLEIVVGALTSPPLLPHPPAHGASLSPSTKNSSIFLYSRIFTAGAAGPLPCASARNACSDCATMARARSFL
jgi:hypothetical protein